ncbi:MAG TPA: glycoside hydrolase family 36 protein [Microlunatus sp.]|nr:glycoside hydrolase family 36 protein [Microlunatus sp.]
MNATQTPTLPTHDLPGLTELTAAAGTTLTAHRVAADVLEITLSAPDGRPRMRAEIDLVDVVAYWQPGGRGPRPLPADWSAPSITSLIRSAPVGVLYRPDGTVHFGWAADQTVSELSIVAGVSEEHKTFVLEVWPTRTLNTDLTVVLDCSGGDIVAGVARLADWMSHRTTGTPRQPAPVARRPVYSTWYTFSQDIDAELVASEAHHAVQAGLGSVFIDDGWQQLAHGRGYQGCGDWQPDPTKFPDLAATVASIHDLGAAVALWVAPLLLGQESRTYPDLARYAPAWLAELNCHVLDPRHSAVRAFAADTCLRLVQDHRVDVLKIDFLDQAMAYGDSPSSGDFDDVGDAMAAMLTQIRRRLDDAGHSDVAFEFRQPYVSPAAARYGEILRANDCPADSLLNRISTLDARLLAVGQVVHADPMMWGPTGGIGAVAQQLYAGWFSVPQISMRLSTLAPDQAATLRYLIGGWRDQAEVLLDGTLHVSGAQHGYDLVRADHRVLRRSTIVRYSPIVVELDHDKDVQVNVINATSDPRLAVRLIRPAENLTVRTADGIELNTITSAAAGLTEITVPAWGSLTVMMS